MCVCVCVDGTAPNPDKLYKLFRSILGINTNEHQILYKECQVRKNTFVKLCLVA